MLVDFVAGALDEDLQHAFAEAADTLISVVLGELQRFLLTDAFDIKLSTIVGGPGSVPVEENVSGCLVKRVDIASDRSRRGVCQEA